MPYSSTWKLKSATREIVDPYEKIEPYGPNPVGYGIFAADGHMMAMILFEKRQRSEGLAATDAEAVALNRSMLSDTGRWSIEGDKLINRVDAAWNETWTGTDQARFFEIEGKTMTLTTAPAPGSMDGRMGVSTLVWEKVR